MLYSNCRINASLSVFRLKAFRGHRSTRKLSNLSDRGALIDVHPEVQEALVSKKPIVALETTIVTHGLPYPTNLENTHDLEKIVRSTGCVPATIGILGGRVKIGLKPSELEYLADKKSNPHSVKVSRRDIGPVLAMKRDGGTTISGTIIFAALAGIKFFGTGGLGGVHRGGENTMDVSADLQELSRYPVAVVSGGVKSILDIGRTLEYLETLGVPVLTYGETNDFPAFFARKSGLKSPYHTSNPKTTAEILHSQWQLGMNNGALIGVPVPEEYEAAGLEIQESVERALVEAEEQGVTKRGKEATPWLLRRVAELTKGNSITNNVALIENTVLIAGKVAAQYAQISKESEYSTMKSYTIKMRKTIRTPTQSESKPEMPPGKLLVVGCSAVDITAQADATTGASSSLGTHSTSPGNIQLTLGGVARNIAEAAHRLVAGESLASPVVLISPIGDDSFGRLITEESRRLHMRVDGLIPRTHRSAVCNMVLDPNGNLTGGVADMGITEELVGQMILASVEKHKPSVIALDGNLSTQALELLVNRCYNNNIPLFFEPTSVVKSGKIISAISGLLDEMKSGRSAVTYASPNLLELGHMYQLARSDSTDLTQHQSWWSVIESFALGSQYRSELELLARKPVLDGDDTRGRLTFLLDSGVAQMATNLLPFFQHIVVKCGSFGVVVAMRVPKSPDSGWSTMKSDPGRRYITAQTPTETIVVQHFPPLPLSVEQDPIVNVTGAGDTLVGAILAKLYSSPNAFHKPSSLAETIDFAQKAAILTLQSHYAVSPQLSNTKQ